MMVARTPLFWFDRDSAADMMFHAESSSTSKRKNHKNPLDTFGGVLPRFTSGNGEPLFPVLHLGYFVLLWCTENIVTCNLVERHYPGLPPLAIWSRIASDQEYRCMTYAEPPIPHSPGFSILILLLSMTVCGVM